MYQLQPLEMRDFSGGMTDNVIGREPSRYELAKNFFITVDKSLAVRPGSLAEGATTAATQTPGGVPVHYLLAGFEATDKPFKLATSTYGRFIYHNGTAHVELLGPTSNHLFDVSHGGATDARFSCASWNGHHYLASTSFTQRPQKVYRDASANLQLRTAGLPAPADTPIIFTGAGGNSYLYAFVYKYTYTVGNRTFIDRGPRLLRTHTGAIPNAISALPVLANGTTDNYDTTNIVLEIYRTTNNGNIYYLAGTVTNGTTTFNDTMIDATLDDQQVIYTNGGVVDFDPPPICKFFHVSERGVGLYGYIQDGADEIKNRVRQSIAGDPDSAPEGFFDDLDDEVTGISSFRGVPVCFGSNSVYRADGIYDRFGNGGLTLRKIADSIGCVSHNSIVQTYQGLFFAGERGFYWTDGYEVLKISDELDTSFQTFYSSATNQRSISGCHDERNQLVLWTFPESNGADGMFVFHMRYGIKRDGVFSRWGSYTSATYEQLYVYPQSVPTTVNQNFKAKCLLYYQGAIYRGDERGFAFRMDEDTKTDPRVDTGADLADWGTTAIYYNFTTAALNFGSDYVRKFTPKLIATLRNRGNLSIQPRVDRDLNETPLNCKQIKDASSYTWGQGGIFWGNPIIYASGSAIIVASRMFPVPGLRCSYRTLILENSFTIVANSDGIGEATVNQAGKTALLVNAATENWPEDFLDYYVSFENDGYLNKFLITVRTDDTITFSDPNNLCPADGDYAWVVRGFAKGEVTEIQSIVLPFAYISDSQEAFRSGSEGENA
jgi:hypothetical protein